MKRNAYNPYLPSWEYIPDGDPYVFNGREYVYGSHDFYNGYVFRMGDYVCWSAPVDDLSDWRYKRVIYPRNADPLNHAGRKGRRRGAGVYFQYHGFDNDRIQIL